MTVISRMRRKKDNACRMRKRAPIEARMRVGRGRSTAGRQVLSLRDVGGRTDFMTEDSD